MGIHWWKKDRFKKKEVLTLCVKKLIFKCSHFSKRINLTIDKTNLFISLQMNVSSMVNRRKELKFHLSQVHIKLPHKSEKIIT